MFSIVTQIHKRVCGENLLSLPGDLRVSVFSRTVCNSNDKCESMASDFIKRSVFLLLVCEGDQKIQMSSYKTNVRGCNM